MKTSEGIKKVIRFWRIYGLNRTYVKVMGRKRNKTFLNLPLPFFKRNKKEVAIIGCGQFAFSTIAYFLKLKRGNTIYGVYDIEEQNAKSLTNYYGGKVFKTPQELINNPNVKYVYVASNHYTHSKYAIEALKNNKIVYIEKPISVTQEQFSNLKKAYSNKTVFVGYNRPFSGAVTEIVSRLKTTERNPLTINCFISGHVIPSDHWYREEKEGTRVCGNIGHWLDLAIHLLNKIGLPKSLEVSIHSSSKTEIDDNLVITFVSNLGDLIVITLSSRSEPFEGINETINIQHGDLIAKIDDFRKLTIWEGSKLTRKKYFIKDVGHKNAILQPFTKKQKRPINEIEISTKLMLDITENILKGKNKFTYFIDETNNSRS